MNRDDAKEAAVAELPGEITALLQAWNGGSDAVLHRLVDRVYDELKRAAVRQLDREARQETLQPTALVNEAYMRLVDAKGVSFPNRAAFFGFAGCLMRRVLVERARRRAAEKRPDWDRAQTLDEAGINPKRGMDLETLMALDNALDELNRIDARKRQLMELWFFAGLDAHEIGALLDRSPITVRRELRAAKLWLNRAMNRRTLASG